jgi:hypothetical protein
MEEKRKALLSAPSSPPCVSGLRLLPSVIPAVGGGDPSEGAGKDLDSEEWIPASAGMTEKGGNDRDRPLRERPSRKRKAFEKEKAFHDM